MSRLKDLTNKKFNMLKVLHRAGSNRQGSSTWLCECDCGNKKVFSSDHLTRKNYPVKSCGCIKKSRKGRDHPLWKGFGEISGNWRFNHVVRERTQTARPKVEVKITIRQAWNLYIKQNRKCALSGLDINFDNIGAYNTASLDRIDSSKGYVKSNVQWVHKDVNFMKRTYSQEYFIKMCKLISNNVGDKCELK